MDLELVRSSATTPMRDVHGSFSGSVDEYLAWAGRLLEQYGAT